MDLSVIIPARNEEFLQQTIDSITKAIKADTEVIAVLDGYWPEVGLADHPKVRLIHHTESIGQRAATNEGVKLSEAKYIMKIDAHCAIDEGFDVKMMQEMHRDWTMIPRMYNLHVFDWKCKKCNNQTYQGPKPTKCEKCDNTTEFERIMIWTPRWNRVSDFARFDSTLHFQYWGDFKKRPEAQGDICDTMSQIGACWMMEKDRYWELGGLDENHGSWGQMGTEISCKTWLSGGRQVVNKKTWFSHLFRTQPGFGFPYPNPGIGKAREHSRKLWIENTWPGAKYPLKWLIKKFGPVPDWPDETSKKVSKGVIYYTDNLPDPLILEICQKNILQRCNGFDIVSVSLKPIPHFGRNIVLPLERGIITMFKQILTGLEACTADVVYMCEHDMIYHESHFDFVPPKENVYYYNENTWKVDSISGQALFYYCKQTSGLVAYRKLLVEHYRKRIAKMEAEGGIYNRSTGFEPGTHSMPRGIDNYPAERFFSEVPNIDIRHTVNLTRNRWRQDQFRNQKSCQGWKMADDVPGWGKSKGRFKDFLLEVL
jgi:glycosyltransferase involved in cell wall biosynthesis